MQAAEERTVSFSRDDLQEKNRIAFKALKALNPTEELKGLLNLADWYDRCLEAESKGAAFPVLDATAEMGVAELFKSFCPGYRTFGSIRNVGRFASDIADKEAVAISGRPEGADIDWDNMSKTEGAVRMVGAVAKFASGVTDAVLRTAEALIKEYLSLGRDTTLEAFKAAGEAEAIGVPLRANLVRTMLGDAQSAVDAGIIASATYHDTKKEIKAVTDSKALYPTLSPEDYLRLHPEHRPENLLQEVYTEAGISDPSKLSAEIRARIEAAANELSISKCDLEGFAKPRVQRQEHRGDSRNNSIFEAASTATTIADLIHREDRQEKLRSATERDRTVTRNFNDLKAAAAKEYLSKVAVPDQPQVQLQHKKPANEGCGATHEAANPIGTEMGPEQATEQRGNVEATLDRPTKPEEPAAQQQAQEETSANGGAGTAAKAATAGAGVGSTFYSYAKRMPKGGVSAAGSATAAKAATVATASGATAATQIGLGTIFAAEAAVIGGAVAAHYATDGLADKILDAIAPEDERVGSSNAVIATTMTAGAAGGAAGAAAVSYGAVLAAVAIVGSGPVGWVAGAAAAGAGLVVGAKAGAAVSGGIGFKAAKTVEDNCCIM